MGELRLKIESAHASSHKLSNSQAVPLVIGSGALAPLDVLFTNSMALQVGTRLADHKSLKFIAHIALAGVPGQKSGDLVSQTLDVMIDGSDINAENKTVYLTIDQILK